MPNYHLLVILIVFLLIEKVIKAPVKACAMPDYCLLVVLIVFSLVKKVIKTLVKACVMFNYHLLVILIVFLLVEKMIKAPVKAHTIPNYRLLIVLIMFLLVEKIVKSFGKGMHNGQLLSVSCFEGVFANAIVIKALEKAYVVFDYCSLVIVLVKKIYKLRQI